MSDRSSTKILADNLREIADQVERIPPMEKRPPSLNKIVAVLADALGVPELPEASFTAIAQAVAKMTHVTIGDLRSKKRTQHIALARQMAFYLCRQLTKRGTPLIGEFFGRDHSTVIAGAQRIAERVDSDANFRKTMQKMQEHIRQEEQDKAWTSQATAELAAREVVAA